MYSTSSSTTKPAIAYAGRLAADAANTLSQGCLVQFAFGDLSDTEIHRSVELFARDIMPELAGLASLAAD